MRVREASHPGRPFTKPSWLSHNGSLRKHIQRFHVSPPSPPTSVLSEWPSTGADVVDDEGRRRRRRGRRSQEARQRLRRREPCTAEEEFTVLHSHVRGFIPRVAELSARLRLMVTKPSVLCLTETSADKGYTPISRHDRADGRQGGGVAVFAMVRLAHRVTLLKNSQVAERSWVYTLGPRALRDRMLVPLPPAPGDVDTIRSFKKKVQLQAASAVGCVVLGDLNVNHRKRLKYSNKNSLEGQELCAVCKELGLTRLVHEPTRGGTCTTWCFLRSRG